MKVKIMDYETAKAKVLARERNPELANDRMVWGVDKTWAGWGQVRDVYKCIKYFLDTAKLLTMKTLSFIAARISESALFLITIISIITRWQTAKLLISSLLVWCCSKED